MEIIFNPLKDGNPYFSSEVLLLLHHKDGWRYEKGVYYSRPQKFEWDEKPGFEIKAWAILPTPHLLAASLNLY